MSTFRPRVGMKVRFKQNLEPGDRQAIMTIRELRGPRVLVTDNRLKGWAIQPTSAYNVSDLKPANRGTIRVRASRRRGRTVRAHLRRAAGR